MHNIIEPVEFFANRTAPPSAVPIPMGMDIENCQSLSVRASETFRVELF